MQVINIKANSERSLVARHCERLYDVLLAKVFRKNHEPASQATDGYIDYDLSLVAECDSRGVVTDIQLSNRHR